MWTGRRILPIYSLWRVVLRSTQGTSDLHGLTELTWPARQQPHSNFLSFFQDVHTQPYSHTQKLSGPFEEGKTAPPGANSDPVTWNCDCHNLPRFRGLLLFSNDSETFHVPWELVLFFLFFRVPKTCHVSSSFFKVKKSVSEKLLQVLWGFFYEPAAFLSIWMKLVFKFECKNDLDTFWGFFLWTGDVFLCLLVICVKHLWTKMLTQRYC